MVDYRSTDETGKGRSPEASKGKDSYRDAGESQLLAWAAGGDKRAFSQLFRRKRPQVERIAARICGPYEAEDVIQVVFLRFWKRLPRFESAGHAHSWLIRATVNRAIDTIRHISRRVKLVEAQKRQEEGGSQRLKQVLQGDMTQVFAQVASKIGQRQRAAFVLREMEGYATKEVALFMGVTRSTVRNLVHQARQGLKRELIVMFPEYAPPPPLPKDENDE